MQRNSDGSGSISARWAIGVPSRRPSVTDSRKRSVQSVFSSFVLLLCAAPISIRVCVVWPCPVAESQNNRLVAAGKEPMPESELLKRPAFRPLQQESRLNSLLQCNQLERFAQEVNLLSTEGMNKVFVIEALARAVQGRKEEDEENAVRE